MSKTLVFGGPALPVGRVTWYETRRDGRLTCVHVRPGDEVDADDVVNCDAARYVDRGLATWKDQPTRKVRADRKKGKE